MAFVFYDTETTGIHLHFDQILQFAAILTDDDLIEIERFEIRCRLLPYVLANPGAMAVTGVTVDQLDNPIYPTHFEMICKIHQKLSEWQPAQFIGHNIIKFDEVLLRSAFYKSLLPPYLTNTNGNSRLDTLPMIQSASLYEPDAITIPIGVNGKPSFKLDLLAPANGFNHANAHDAMADVEATIFMCLQLRDRAPDTWSRFMRFANKNSVLDFCSDEEVFGLTEFYFGKPYTFMLHQIGNNPNNNNEILAFDLVIDPDGLANCTEDELNRLINGRPKPIRRFSANALPSLVEEDEAHPLSNSRNISIEIIEARAEQLGSNPELKARLVAAYLATKQQYDVSPHVEENLYSGFANGHDGSLMHEFHKADWQNRYSIACKFEDARYQELGERLIYVESPDHLSVQRRQYWQTFFAERLMGEGEPCDALILPDAIQLADDMIANANTHQKQLLVGHRDKLVAQYQNLKASFV